MLRRNRGSLLVLLGALASFMLSTHAPAIEPYPFKTKPREVDKVEVLKIDFEGSLPEGAELGKNAKVEEKGGRDGSKGLLSKGKGLVIKIPIKQSKVDATGEAVLHLRPEGEPRQVLGRPQP